MSCVCLREVVACEREVEGFGAALADFFGCFRAATLARTVARTRLTASRASVAVRLTAEPVRDAEAFARDLALAMTFFAAGFFAAFFDVDFLVAGLDLFEERAFEPLLDLVLERVTAPFVLFFVLPPDFLRAVAISISFSFR